MKPTASELGSGGYEPVAVIGKEPEELTAGRNLVFEDRHDDLDTMRECTFTGPSGATFALVRYAHATRPGTQLLVKTRTLPQATELLAEAAEVLDLSMPDLTWIRQELWAGMSAASERRAAARRAERADEEQDEADATPQKDVEMVKADAALAKIVGSREMSRKELTVKLWAYIKRKGLQDKRNRRMIVADDALRPIFGKAEVNMLDLPKLVDRHLKSPRTRR